MAKKRPTGSEPITIKKYANRRLYNTATSSYVTLDHLAEMVKNNQDFVVFDAKTGDDITRSVLTQIIFEEEAKGGQNLLPIRFMRQLIKFYGDSLQGFVPSYLEMSMEQFAKEQERLRNRLAGVVGGERLQQLEEQVRNNIAAFEGAMRMFTPFGSGGTREDKRADEAEEVEAKPAAKPSAEESKEIKALQDQLAAMQQQIDALAKTKKDD